jgi:hypothetical protein
VSSDPESVAIADVVSTTPELVPGGGPLVVETSLVEPVSVVVARESSSLQPASVKAAASTLGNGRRPAIPLRVTRSADWDQKNLRARSRRQIGW